MWNCSDPDGIMEDMADYNRIIKQELIEEAQKNDISERLFSCPLIWLDELFTDPEIYASAMERINNKYNELNK